LQGHITALTARQQLQKDVRWILVCITFSFLFFNHDAGSKLDQVSADGNVVQGFVSGLMGKVWKFR
jgi:hypothetical protein